MNSPAFTASSKKVRMGELVTSNKNCCMLTIVHRCLQKPFFTYPIWKTSNIPSGNKQKLGNDLDDGGFNYLTKSCYVPIIPAMKTTRFTTETTNSWW